MKYICLLLIAIVLHGCDQPKNIAAKEADEMYLEIRYRHPNATFIATIPCPDMKYRGEYSSFTKWYDFKITDEKLLEKFHESYLKLQPDKKGETYIDTEAGLLFHHGTQVDTLCISKFGHTVLNGIRQTDNPELFLLIKDSIEKNFEPIKRERYDHLKTK